MHNQGNTFFVDHTRMGIGAMDGQCDNCPMDLRIAELLDKKGVSQSQMARDLGVKQPTVSRWVSGESSPPTKKLKQIADYFEIEPILLFKNYAERKEFIDLILVLLKLDDHDILAVSALADRLSQRGEQLNS